MARTISTTAADTGVSTPTSLPLATTKPFMNSISVRRPLTTSWAMDERQFRVAPALGTGGVDRAVRLGLRAGLGPLVGGGSAELHHAMAEAQAHARRLRAQADGDLAAPGLGGDVASAEAGHGLDGVAHGIDAQLAPALAPQVVGGLRGIDDRQEIGHRLEMGGRLAVG